MLSWGMDSLALHQLQKGGSGSEQKTLSTNPCGGLSVPTCWSPKSALVGLRLAAPARSCQAADPQPVPRTRARTSRPRTSSKGRARPARIVPRPGSGFQSGFASARSVA
jgi:hypothetical protein